jgi:hypothetical protein
MLVHERCCLPVHMVSPFAERLAWRRMMHTPPAARTATPMLVTQRRTWSFDKPMLDTSRLDHRQDPVADRTSPRARA